MHFHNIDVKSSFLGYMVQIHKFINTIICYSLEEYFSVQTQFLLI